jgi:hypothetical protein
MRDLDHHVLASEKKHHSYGAFFTPYAKGGGISGLFVSLFQVTNFV